MLASCRPLPAVAPHGEQFYDLSASGVAKLRASDATARLLLRDGALRTLLAAVPDDSWDHAADAPDHHEGGAHIFDRIAAIYPPRVDYIGYLSWPFSKTVAIDGATTTVYVNRRKLGAFQAEDYVGTVWHELSHKAGYFHTGNLRLHNECTVPDVVGDAAVAVAKKRATGRWPALPRDACEGLRRAIAAQAP